MAGYEQEGQEPFDDLFDAFASFAKRRPKAFRNLAIGTATLAVGASLGLYSFLKSGLARQEIMQREFERKLEGIEGRIAYVVNSEIHVVDANESWRENAQIERIQGEGILGKVLMADDHTLVYTSKSPLDKIESFDVTSDTIYVYDFKTDSTNKILDPYSPELDKLFGNARMKDEGKEKEFKEAIDKKTGLIVVGDHSAIRVADLGYDRDENMIYAKINDAWYKMKRDGSDLSLASKIQPNLRTINNKSRDMDITLEDAYFGPLYFTDGYSTKSIESGSNNPDWYKD